MTKDNKVKTVPFMEKLLDGVEVEWKKLGGIPLVCQLKACHMEVGVVLIAHEKTTPTRHRRHY